VTAPDERITLAREYLAAARGRPIDHMPPSRLAAELAETRRQLGLVLAAAADQPHTLTGAQLVIVLTALADAETYVTERAAAWCDACESAPEGACSEHVEDLDQADVYRQLAREIGDQQ
jgi:hypothetical protein